VVGSLLRRFIYVGGVFFESLILAQDERWRRALGMQMERFNNLSQDLLLDSRRRVSNTQISTFWWGIAGRKAN
jgi:hypothetical protein